MFTVYRLQEEVDMSTKKKILLWLFIFTVSIPLWWSMDWTYNPF